MARPAPQAVVVSGMGVMCSIGADVPAFTAALREGRCGIGLVPSGDGGPPMLAAVIGEFSFADAVAARLALPEPTRRAVLRAARRSPRAVQVALVAAIQAWQDARLHEAPVAADRLGLVVAGHNITSAYAYEQHARHLANPAHVPARFALQVLDTDHVGTLSQALGIRGEGYTVGAASASGNVGIVHGSRLVESGAVDACLVVGAMTELSPPEWRSLAALGAVAGGAAREPERSRCRPFDKEHEGFAPGQASACVVLESAASARRRAAPILAELAGYALRLDANSLPDARADGEAAAMCAAIARAGVRPGAIGYVNAHATATPSGDETELMALRRAFGAALAKPWVNATKGLTGHCLCAAGVVEAVATVAQMGAGFVHPNLYLRRPLDADVRFTGAVAELADIEYALSNSVGFGGFNTSLVLRRSDG